MLALRYAALLALVVWVGGLVILGAVVAPSTFDVLGTTGAAGTHQAGTLFGEILRRFHLITYGCGAVVLISLITRAILGPRPRRFAIRLSLAAVMIAASGWVGVVVAPQISSAQREIGAPMTSVPPHDPRRETFERLHRLSSRLEMLPFFAGLALLFWEMKD
ncbi:MAG: DUF4149 domain-containing protein [Vicinamibacterales bacterium]